MARRTKEDAQETRRTILEAAIEVFSSKGVSRTSLTDIAREAEVTRGAIYWHFKNKDDLLANLWDQLLQPFEPIARASEDPEELDPLGRLREMLLLFLVGLGHDQQRQKLFRIFLDKCESNEAIGSLQLRHHYRRAEGFSRVANILRNAMAHGQLPKDLDPHLGAVLIISCMDGLIANWLTRTTLFDIEVQGPILVDSVLTMLQHGSKHDGLLDQVAAPYGP